METFGIDWDELTTDDDVTIEIPETESPLSDADYEALTHSIDPCAPSDSYGIDLFASTLEFVCTSIQVNQ